MWDCTSYYFLVGTDDCHNYPFWAQCSRWPYFRLSIGSDTICNDPVPPFYMILFALGLVPAWFCTWVHLKRTDDCHNHPSYWGPTSLLATLRLDFDDDEPSIIALRSLLHQHQNPQFRSLPHRQQPPHSSEYALYPKLQSDDVAHLLHSNTWTSIFISSNSQLPPELPFALPPPPLPITHSEARASIAYDATS
ncbi:hypothetical protein TIFTF001_023236 [Ficus carica]|uniref:Uncharacterized protein n=1 Tax=Ficus carica TaxID=3494 RepID=A0AA88AUE9_FICCA|nr:hypothetical protein TIFTF001_023236 [Ficus carica]